MPTVRHMARSDFERRFPARDTEATKALAVNVRRLRKEKGWTQDALAAALGVEQGAVSLIENGRANPTLQVLEQLASELEVRVQDLFEPESKSRKSKGTV